MNIKLLQKVKKHILADPRRLDMDIWVKHDVSEEGPVCGTVACIAGWAVLLSHPRKEWDGLIKTQHNASYGFPVGEEAQSLLRLDDEQAKVLFGVNGVRYAGREGTIKHAAAACKRIDEFIAKHKGD